MSLPRPKEPQWPRSARSQLRPENERVSRLLFTALLVLVFAGAGAFFGGAALPKHGYRERDPATGQVITFRDSPEKSSRRVRTGAIAGAILGAVLSVIWWRDPMPIGEPHEALRPPRR